MPSEGLKIVLFDWDVVGKNDRVREIEISAEQMWDVMRAPIGWTETEGESSQRKRG